MHNTFDVQIKDQLFVVTSHNFPDMCGTGISFSRAITDLNKKLVYYADNNPVEYKNKLQARLKRGLSCECGEKLESDVIAIYKGRV